MDKAVIVYNPMARKAPAQEQLRALARDYVGDGWQIELQVTQAPGHATELAREAAQAGASVVFACGGDGTVNEAVNGLAGGTAALALLRGGMGDVLARETGIPKLPGDALRLLLDGELRRFDLGLAARRYFLLMAGVGLDAQVVRDVPPRLKRLLGSTSYALGALGALPRYRSRGVVMEVDGDEVEARLYWLLLGNTRSYGGITRIASRALAGDGLLDAYVFEGGGPAWLVKTAARLVLRRPEGGEGVSFQRVRELQVRSLGLPVQVDGEYIGETPMHFSIAPSALDVLLPRGHASELFSQRTALAVGWGSPEV